MLSPILTDSCLSAQIFYTKIPVEILFFLYTNTSRTSGTPDPLEIGLSIPISSGDGLSALGSMECFSICVHRDWIVIG